MQFTDAENAALAGDYVRIGIFVNIGTAVPLTVWLGIGDIEPGVNRVDETGATYSGLGQLTQVPEFQQLINFNADRWDLGLSGVSGDVLALTARRAAVVKHKTVSIGFALMDSDWKLLGEIRWSRRGFVDVVSISQDPQSDLNASITRKVSVSVGSQSSGRRRRGLSYLTDVDQQRRSPGDLFCERTTAYAQGVTKPFPKF
jgi:hypothetical protein